MKYFQACMSTFDVALNDTRENKRSLQKSTRTFDDNVHNCSRRQSQDLATDNGRGQKAACLLNDSRGLQMFNHKLQIAWNVDETATEIQCNYHVHHNTGVARTFH